MKKKENKLIKTDGFSNNSNCILTEDFFEIRTIKEVNSVRDEKAEDYIETKFNRITHIVEN